MKKKDLLFTVPVFRETNVYVLAGDREEARRIAEECVLSGAFIETRTQSHSIDSDGVPITREEVDKLEKSGKRIYTGDSMSYSKVIRNILVASGFDSLQFTIDKLLGTATYCVRFYDTMDLISLTMPWSHSIRSPRHSYLPALTRRRTDSLRFL